MISLYILEFALGAFFAQMTKVKLLSLDGFVNQIGRATNIIHFRNLNHDAARKTKNISLFQVGLLQLPTTQNDIHPTQHILPIY